MTQLLKWHEMARTPKKGESMPKTIEHYQKILAMDDELIHEQRDEIAKLKMTINKLRQRIK